jgi:radical SAM superfamily enzyme YgiQ (UPF0313 family)
LDSLSVHLVNPSDNSFGTAVITPRWLFVLAAATPRDAGDPVLVDESLEQIVPETILPGDIVGISVHTGNALRGYAVGRMARSRGAWVIYGGIHATLFPEEVLERGEAHAVVTGDGDVAWGKAVADCLLGLDESRKIYVGLGADHSWMPEALFLLQCVADRWAKAAPKKLSKSDRRNRGLAADWISIHRPGRR